MFHAETNQSNYSFNHPVRSSYDAGFRHSAVHNPNPTADKIRVFEKVATVGSKGHQDISAWEVTKGRPLPPSSPWGRFLLPNVYSVDEWKKRYYAMLATVSSITGLATYMNGFRGPSSISLNRKRWVALRSTYSTMLATLVGGLIWIEFTGYKKQQSNVGVHYILSIRDRFQVATLMGMGIGGLSLKNSHPFYGQWSRGSMMFYWVKRLVFIYAIMYGVVLHGWTASTMTRFHMKPQLAEYNVIPWWHETPTLPHKYSGAALSMRATPAWRQMEGQVARDPQELVDEYSPEHEFKKRYKYHL